MLTPRHSLIAATLAAAFAVSACGSMSERTRNTAIGAGVGGVAGSVLTGGSTAGTIGGAAVGGLIGNRTADDKK